LKIADVTQNIDGNNIWQLPSEDPRKSPESEFVLQKENLMQLIETFAEENNLKKQGQLEEKSATDDSSTKKVEDKNTTTQSVTQTFAKPTCSSDELNSELISDNIDIWLNNLSIPFKKQKNGTFSFNKKYLAKDKTLTCFHVDVFFKGLSDNLGCKVPVKGKKECSKVFDSLEQNQFVEIK
jgi:hypothetical protein